MEVRAQFEIGKEVAFEPVSIHFTTLDGLGSNKVFSSVFLKETLVLSTVEGITLFNGDVFQNFDSEDVYGGVIKAVPFRDSNAVMFYTDINELGILA